MRRRTRAQESEEEASLATVTVIWPRGETVPEFTCRTQAVLLTVCRPGSLPCKPSPDAQLVHVLSIPVKPVGHGLVPGRRIRSSASYCRGFCRALRLAALNQFGSALREERLNKMALRWQVTPAILRDLMDMRSASSPIFGFSEASFVLRASCSSCRSCLS